MKRTHIAIIVISLVLIIDQALKIYIKTNFYYGESLNILGLEWAQLKFVENPGMAFGIEWGGVIGKYFLSIFRVCMVGFLIYFLGQLIKMKESRGFIACFALIIAGAIGNILDSLYFGIIFSESSYHTNAVAEFMPEAGGYSSFLQGNVVDMLYFPMVKSHFPDWSPIWAGQYFEFFRPIFNIADASISVGVVLIIIFFRKFFSKKPIAVSTEATVSEDAKETNTGDSDTNTPTPSIDPA